MSLPLTRETLAAAYDFLRSTPPFKTWNLPEPEDVTFKVAKDPHLHGWHDKKRGKKAKHVVAVSARTNGHTLTLLETMAHEMVHLHEQHNGVRSRAVHGTAFRKFAAQVCRAHGFDHKRF